MDLDHDTCYRAIETRDVRFDGRLFVGVHTTGIYCRPICPARTPKRENVSFYVTAAAAQAAGFRSCLRCRPESSPDLAAWQGSSSTVTRALALIAEGAMDDTAVHAVAARLGVGDRQLRRLFKQHLGASPVAVAQTRRVLFAQQLIAQTRMPLTEVALGAGFGSVRRFNATFQALYERPPRELRRVRAGSNNEASAASGIVLSLPFISPYDWPSMIGFLAARAIPGVEAVDARGRYHRSVALDGAQGTVCVEPHDDDRSLRLTIRFPRVQKLAAIVGRIRRVFDLGADPVAIGAHLSSDPALAPLLAARPGLRVPGAWDGFEIAVRAILGQQVTVRAATQLAGKLAAAYGHPLEELARLAGLTHVFPSAEVLAMSDLRSLGMPGTRAVALSSLARTVVADPGFFSASQTLDEALSRLRAISGVGDWTAQYIAMRALREPDAFPAADIGLLRAMTRPGERRPGAAELLARAEAWRPWRAYAAVHLWTSESDVRPANDPRSPIQASSRRDHAPALA